MAKTIMNRIKDLEAGSGPDYSGHDYKHAITWGDGDNIVNKYYKDGQEIRRSQFEREAPKEPLNINIKWIENNGKGTNGQNSNE
jgi:hypothetical protein